MNLPLWKTFLLSSWILSLAVSEKVFLNEFAVHIRGGKLASNELATKYGYVNKGQIGGLQDHYLFSHHSVQKRSTLPANEREHRLLQDEPMVEWVEQQHIHKRVKRDETISNISDPTTLSDPLYNDQWYMSRSDAPTMNVEGAWALGYTGHGVVVSILDDGIELTHPDLKRNYDRQASYDFNNNDNDPSPRYDYTNENKHGTRCAGEVAMQADNDVCGVGVAFNAGIGGVRMLDGVVTDSVEASSLSYAMDHIDIYSSSWGPDDDGRTVDGPGQLAKQAFTNGVLFGRGGLGSIYVWASGNGGRVSDSCGCDGYTNSIYTLSISSTTEHGNKPWYLEECASTLATTYSSGASYERQIISTDLHQQCTDRHSGTSASAPMAAGILALALQANPKLIWRDVQHLVVRTSRRKNLQADDWTVNGAGYEVSHSYGFGLMDAEALVRSAKTWKPVSEQSVCEINVIDSPRTINKCRKLQLSINTTSCRDTFNQVDYLEHVHATVSLSFEKRGALTLRLISPYGTESTLLPPRSRDYSAAGFEEWPFMSTHFWGERPYGTWILEIDSIEGYDGRCYSGAISQWKLVMYGTKESTDTPESGETTTKGPKSTPYSRVKTESGGTTTNGPPSTPYPGVKTESGDITISSLSTKFDDTTNTPKNITEEYTENDKHSSGIAVGVILGVAFLVTVGVILLVHGKKIRCPSCRVNRLPVFNNRRVDGYEVNLI